MPCLRLGPTSMPANAYAYERGPLAGVEGFVVSTGHDNLRIVVSVDLLQRSVAAEVDRECVERVLDFHH